MVIELVRIRTAQQYPMLMPTLFPGDLATREKPYITLASMWTAFNDLKHNMSPAIDGDAFASAARASGSHAPPTVAVPAASTAVSQRHYGRPPRPSHSVSNISHTHSRRDPFRVDYGLWPFDDKDYDIVCTVTNHMINTNMSLWTPLLTADARRQACIQHSGRCCNCGLTEHSLRWCPSPFANVFPSSTRNLPHMTKTDPYLNHGKKACASGGGVTPTVNIKVMAGVTLLDITTPDPTTKVMETPTTKVTVTAPHYGHTSPQLRLNF